MGVCMYLYLFTSTAWKFICTVCSTVYSTHAFCNHEYHTKHSQQNPNQIPKWTINQTESPRTDSRDYFLSDLNRTESQTNRTKSRSEPHKEPRLTRTQQWNELNLTQILIEPNALHLSKRQTQSRLLYKNEITRNWTKLYWIRHCILLPNSGDKMRCTVYPHFATLLTHFVTG